MNRDRMDPAGSAHASARDEGLALLNVARRAAVLEFWRRSGAFGLASGQPLAHGSPEPNRAEG